MAESSQTLTTISPGQEYQTLLAVSAAIVSHRDLGELFHELASLLHQMVRFDYLGLVLHDAATNAMRPHVLEPPEATPRPPDQVFPIEEHPAGLVWQTQQAMILFDLAAETRWPPFVE